MDNPTNPVEEDSDYNITITAVNSVGRSAPSNLAFTTTAQAGIAILHPYCQHLINKPYYCFS